MNECYARACREKMSRLTLWPNGVATTAACIDVGARHFIQHVIMIISLKLTVLPLLLAFLSRVLFSQASPSSVFSRRRSLSLPVAASVVRCAPVVVDVRPTSSPPLRTNVGQHRDSSGLHNALSDGQQRVRLTSSQE